MRKFVIAVSAMAALTIPMVASATARRHVHFTSKVVGAAISATQSTYKLHDSVFGNGAGVQTIKLNATATGGTDTETTYYGNASAKSKGTFKLGAPDANGILTVTGSGRDISGTGKAKGLRSTYTFSGTIDSKTSVIKVTLKGTYTY
jgi:hypothetical protein